MTNRQEMDAVNVKRETSKIWLGVGLAVFGCLLIIAGVCIPPVGVIDGSVLTAVGEVFSLAGACLSMFSLNRRNNAKIDSIYRWTEEQRNTQDDGTSAEEDVQ